MTVLASTAPLTLLDLSRPGHPTAAGRGEPAWLTRTRRDAWAWIEANGFPTKRDEDWRYLPLDAVLELRVDPVTSPGSLGSARRTDARWADVVGSASLELGGSRLVFLDGWCSPLLSRLVPPSATTIGSLASVLSGEPHPARPAVGWPGADGPAAGWPTHYRPAQHRHAFTALNVALAADGAVLSVPPGTVVDRPVELVFVNGVGDRPGLVSSRSHVRLGAGSRATVVEVHVGVVGNGSLANVRTVVELAEGAELDHYVLSDQPDESFHFSALEVHQGARSRFSSRLVALGSAVARHEVELQLEGEGAESDLDGLSLPFGHQFHDHPVLVEHAAPDCLSRQRYLGVVGDSAHAVFNGHVVVRPGAGGTDASQSNKNLLLSARAEVDTRPRLEIFADDVACAHGAAVGRLDADALFYLRSRGVPEKEARAVLVQGFVAQMVERIELDAFRRRIDSRLAERLGAGPAGADRRPAPEPRTGTYEGGAP